MGSIVSIYSNPKTWNITETDKRLKPEHGGEKLVKVTYGEWDDEPSGTQPMKLFIRESIITKVLSGEYTVHPSSYHRHQLILQNKDGSIIPRVLEGNSLVY